MLVLGLNIARSLLGLIPNEIGLILSRQILERSASGFGDQKRGENASQHEEGKDLEKMVDPLVGAANVFEGTEADLGNDSTKLATGCGNTVTSGAIASREHLAGDDEGGRVGAKVEEQLGQCEKDKEQGGRVVEDGVVTETEDEEDDGQDAETTQLDGLATNPFNGEYGDPVAYRAEKFDN
ncbi:hypothetical protein BC937DRAFT_86334 [Endogone sp. FLAS-F59071]|nr:hypothetical protein BC937DRAFT_86334 [Endogone sp. FLAS-F59071]|eukprot:RUS20113.1 hypothetical protein BC937DRAFT_86334 [Endogone sp. FLAS-F59071]